MTNSKRRLKPRGSRFIGLEPQVDASGLGSKRMLFKVSTDLKKGAVYFYILIVDFEL